MLYISFRCFAILKGKQLWVCKAEEAEDEYDFILKCQDTAAEYLLIYSKNITDQPAISSDGSERVENPDYMRIIHE